MSLIDGSFFAEAKDKVVGLVNQLGSISKLDLLSASNKVCLLFFSRPVFFFVEFFESCFIDSHSAATRQ